jgi:hypothetical protein
MSYISNSDSKKLFYLPIWARTLILSASIFALLVSIAIAIAFTLRTGDGDKVLIAMSVAQLAMGGLLFVVVLFFSQRDENVSHLKLRSDSFLKIHVRSALSAITVPDAGIEYIEVDCLNEKDLFGFQFRLSAPLKWDYVIWVGLNVNRIFVIYFLPVHGEEIEYLKKIRNVFEFTFGGAEAIQYKANYELATVNGERLISIWLTAPTAHELLTDPAEKLFWAQDVAMMTASFLRTAHRAGIDLEMRARARPL